MAFTDLKRTTGTAGQAPFVADLNGYTNYYAFGMVQPGREANLGGGRYGYNGKEMDNDWNDRNGGGNSYDFGARIYEPRLGRWLSEDPEANVYPDVQPYAYALNTPLNAADPDGRLVIFINGFRMFGWVRWEILDPNMRNLWPSEQEFAEGYQSVYRDDHFGYWGNMDDMFIDRIGDQNSVYFDASNAIFSTADHRYQIGVAAGEALLRQIENGEIELKCGESIKIVAHSQGISYGAGLASVFDRKVRPTIVVNGQEMPMPYVEVVYAITPKQPYDIVWPDPVLRSVQYSAGEDWIASAEKIRNSGEYVPYRHDPSTEISRSWTQFGPVDIEHLGEQTLSGGHHTVESWQFIFNVRPGEKGYVAPRKDAPCE